MSFLSSLVADQTSNATGAALDTLAEKPINIVLSIDGDTKLFIASVLIAAVMVFVAIKKIH